MKAVYPVLCSDRLPESRDFYRDLLDLSVVFETDWYVALVHPNGSGAQIGLVDARHESVPARQRTLARGVLVTVDVDDADAVYARARELDVPIELDLRDEAWGQRHFIAADPNGVLVDVVQAIAPTDEFAASYAPGALS